MRELRCYRVERYVDDKRLPWRRWRYLLLSIRAAPLLPLSRYHCYCERYVTLLLICCVDDARRYCCERVAARYYERDGVRRGALRCGESAAMMLLRRSVRFMLLITCRHFFAAYHAMLLHYTYLLMLPCCYYAIRYAFSLFSP